MRAHHSTIVSRMYRAALRVNPNCAYRVVAAGADHRGRIIGLSTNAPNILNRETLGLHAEERLIHRSPKSLRRVYILRVGRSGNVLPIDPCGTCSRLANKRGIEIVSVTLL